MFLIAAFTCITTTKQKGSYFHNHLPVKKERSVVKSVCVVLEAGIRLPLVLCTNGGKIMQEAFLPPAASHAKARNHCIHCAQGRVRTVLLCVLFFANHQGGGNMLPSHEVGRVCWGTTLPHRERYIWHLSSRHEEAWRMCICPWTPPRAAPPLPLFKAVHLVGIVAPYNATFSDLKRFSSWMVPLLCHIQVVITLPIPEM